MLQIKTILNNVDEKKYSTELDIVKDVIDYYAGRYKSTLKTIIENFKKGNVRVDALTALFLKDFYAYLSHSECYFNVGKYNFFSGEEKPTTLVDITIQPSNVIKPLTTEKTDEITRLVATADSINDILLVLKLFDDVYTTYIND